MNKRVWVIFCLSICILILGGCKEISKDLFPEDEIIKNTVVDAELLTTYGSLIGQSDEEVVKTLGEGVVEAGYSPINGYPYYLPREYHETAVQKTGKTIVTFAEDETHQSEYYGEEIPIVVWEIHTEIENTDRDFVVEAFQSFAAVLGDPDCTYGNFGGKYADGFWVDDKGILYSLRMDQQNATETGMVNLYVWIERDHGYRDENFGRYDL